MLVSKRFLALPPRNGSSVLPIYNPSWRYSQQCLHGIGQGSGDMDMETSMNSPSSVEGGGVQS